jgi:prefoldin alpha subunit
MSQDKERQLRRIVSEMQMMEGSVQILEQRSQILGATLQELRLAQTSLSSLKNVDEGNPILIPVGGSVFMNATLGGIEKVIVGVGANVSVEMSYDKAVEEINSRLDDLDKSLTSVQEQLSQILAQLDTHQGMAERLSNEIQNAIQGVK